MYTLLQKSILFLLTLAVLSSQAQTKKNLTQDDYGKWQTLGATTLSPDGDWYAYQVTVQEDNDTLYAMNRKTNKSYKLAFSSRPEFSKDNKWLAFQTTMAYKDAEKLREQMKPVDLKMGLLNLATGKKEIVQRISNFEFSRNGKFLAITLAPEIGSKEKGSVLLIKNLTDSTTRTIGNVTEYSFNKKSDRLVYIVEAANSAGNTVELFNLKDNSIKILASDTTKFSKLSWQKEGDGLAFYRSFRKNGFEEDNAIVYVYSNLYKNPVMQKFDPETADGFPKGMRISAASRLSLSDDMTTGFFGIKKWTANPLAKKDDK
ncbi:MAG: hypothetical protein ABI151_02145, partial [Chitinophagaceae bacterium]